MTYKECITEAMLKLAQDERVLFIGQGLLDKEPFYGTLTGVPRSKMLEMPCAESLTTGVATGLALTGWIPVLLFQRMDFMLLAADQIINHLAIMPKMSGGQFKLPMIIRCCVGSQDEKFQVGIQHNKNFKILFMDYLTVFDMTSYLSSAFELPKESTMVVEYKDMYGTNV